jgi:hypothetical protein
MRTEPEDDQDFENCLCMPLIDSAPREAKVLLLEAWTVASATREALLRKQWDWYSANGVMPIIPHSQVSGHQAFNVVSVDAMMRELVGRIS